MNGKPPFDTEWYDSFEWLLFWSVLELLFILVFQVWLDLVLEGFFDALDTVAQVFPELKLEGFFGLGLEGIIELLLEGLLDMMLVVLFDSW